MLLLPAVLAETWAAEVEQWAWLGGMESESAAGSLNGAWSYQCQGLSASDSSDTTIPVPAKTKRLDVRSTFIN